MTSKISGNKGNIVIASFAFVLLLIPISFAGPFEITDQVMQQAGIILAIAFALLAVAMLVSRAFNLQQWEAWVRQEWVEIILSAILLILISAFASVIDASSSTLANEALQTKIASGDRVDLAYWGFNNTNGRWYISNTQILCTSPCHFYIARALVGSTYEKYIEMLAKKVSNKVISGITYPAFWEGLAPYYGESLLYESFGMGGGVSVRLIAWTLSFRFSMPPFAGRAMLNNSLEMTINVMLQALGSLKFQEMALLVFQNLAGILFAAGILLRILWFTRRLGGLLIACAIGIYCIYPLIYVLGWYTVDSSTIELSTATQQPDMSVSDIYSAPGAVEKASDQLFTDYNTGQIGIFDIVARAYIITLVIPVLAIFATIGFIRHFSPMIGGDTEIAGLTKLI